MKEKTIYEWLSSIKDITIHEAALRNLENNKNKNRGNLVVSSLGNAIRYAFYWDSTPEKSKYWSTISYKAAIGEISMDDSIDMDY